MTVSKRLRFEILRRDNHACRYCGATAPEATLTVDHVTPVALGGTDEPSNLVAACRDCNSGKSATPPGAPLVDDAKADALRWALAMRDAQARELFELKMRDEVRDAFLEVWFLYDKWRRNLPETWASSLEQFLAAGLPFELIAEAVEIAWSRPGIPGPDRFRYFAGVCWKRITALQEKAAKQYEATGGDS